MEHIHPSPDRSTSVVNKIGFRASSSWLAFIDRFLLCLLASGWDFPRYPWVLPKLPSFRGVDYLTWAWSIHPVRSTLPSPQLDCSYSLVLRGCFSLSLNLAIWFGPAASYLLAIPPARGPLSAYQVRWTGAWVLLIGFA